MHSPAALITSSAAELRTKEPNTEDLHALLTCLAGNPPSAVALSLVSLTPTRHQVTLESGVRVFTWCALDTLLVPRLLGCDASISTYTPGNDAPLQPTIRAGRLVADLAWTLSFPLVDPRSTAHFTAIFCPAAHLFPSMQAYRRWDAEQEQATAALPIAEADRIAREYARDIQRRSPQAHSPCNSTTACTPSPAAPWPHH